VQERKKKRRFEQEGTERTEKEECGAKEPL
jgi:hypothetical protein